MVAKGEAGYGRLDWGVGKSKCKLLCIEWINNNVLLYSKENYVHYPVINHNENMKKNTHTQTHIHK